MTSCRPEIVPPQGSEEVEVLDRGYVWACVDGAAEITDRQWFGPMFGLRFTDVEGRRGTGLPVPGSSRNIRPGQPMTGQGADFAPYSGDDVETRHSGIKITNWSHLRA
jgi:hypothetical protein